MAGRAKVMLDSFKAFSPVHVNAETIVASQGTNISILDGKHFVFVKGEGKVYVQPALDAIMGYKEGITMRAILR